MNIIVMMKLSELMIEEIPFKCSERMIKLIDMLFWFASGG